MATWQFVVLISVLIWIAEIIRSGLRQVQNVLIHSNQVLVGWRDEELAAMQEIGLLTEIRSDISDLRRRYAPTDRERDAISTGRQ